MKIEDIAIIRETLAELDDEELTALDLENHNFKKEWGLKVLGTQLNDHLQLESEVVFWLIKSSRKLKGTSDKNMK